jgi:hypothetical protein
MTVRRIAKLVLAGLFFGAMSPTFAQRTDQKMTFAQRTDQRLNQTIPAYDSDKTSTLEQLIEVAQQFQIPMGIEWADAPNETNVKPIHFHNISVKEIISRIANEKSGYRSIVSDGVVQVSKLELTNDPLNFLNVRFPNYAVEDDSLFEASYWLRVSIKRTLHPEVNIGGGLGGKSAQEDFNKPTIHFSATDVTVREILNRLVAAQGNCLWVVHLNPALLMEGEPFYAQVVSSPAGKGNSDFSWDFIPLLTKTTTSSERNSK